MSASGGRGILEEAIFHLKSSGTAVDRTAYSKMSDWISVKDYGALGDGLNDDTNAIANAIAAASGTQLLNFPVPGTYVTSTYGTVTGGVYYPPRPGAMTLRSVPAKLFDTLSVLEFGADPTGVADSAAAIQAALDAVPVGGGTLNFAPGTYKISAHLAPSVDTTIIGSGLCQLVPAVGFTGAGTAAFYIRSARVVIQGLTFSGFFQALDVNGITDLTVQNNRVLSALGPGLGVISTCSRVRILDNTIDSTAAPNISISVHGVHDLVIARNLITNAGDDGITVRALTGSTDMVIVSDNIIDDCGKAGIKVTTETSSVAGAQVQRVIVHGNVITGWGAHVNEAGITLDNGLVSGEHNQFFAVTGNTIESKNRANEETYISAANVRDVAITGNVMRGGVASAGINVQSSNYVAITGNMLADACKVSAATNIGGIMLLSANYCTVQGNTIRNPGKSGNNRPCIYAEQSTYNAVCGNVCIDDQGTQATGTLTLAAVVAADTAVVGGVTFTASASVNTGTSFLVGGTDAITATNLAAAITRTSTDSSTAVGASNVVTVTARNNGTEGNALTLVGGAHITASGATLSGGTYVPTMSYGIEFNGAGAQKDDFNTVIGNVIKGAATAPILLAFQQKNQFWMNVGDFRRITQTLTFTSGATVRAIAHSLGVQPTRITLTPTSDLGSSTKWWGVINANTSNININMVPDPGVNVTFSVLLEAGFE